MISQRRALYNKLKKENPGKVISYSYLRVEEIIKNTKNSYKFNILKSNGVDGLTEVKLDKNDRFVMTHLGIFLLAQDSAAPGKAVLQSYPNETVFAPVAGPPAFVPSDLELIYNGKLHIKVGTTQFVENFPMWDFRAVPETQQSAGNNKSQADENSGFIEMTPIITLSGAKDTTIQIEVPIDGTIEMEAQAAGINNKLVFLPKGFLIKDGAK